MEITEILRLTSQAGAFGIIVLFFVLAAKGKVRWEREVTDKEAQLQELKKERDDWRQLALHGTSLAEQTVNLFRKS
jgi:hypothetical protein